MIVNPNSWVVNTPLVHCQICRRYIQIKSLPCINFMYCMFDRNWSLFLVTNKSIEYIYWDWIGRIFSSLNSCRQEVFLFEFIITLIILFWILKMTSLQDEFPIKPFYRIIGVLLKMQGCEGVNLYSHVRACPFQLSSGFYPFPCQSPTGSRIWY